MKNVKRGTKVFAKYAAIGFLAAGFMAHATLYVPMGVAAIAGLFVVFVAVDW